MSALAHPGPIVPLPVRRRHLRLVAPVAPVVPESSDLPVVLPLPLPVRRSAPAAVAPHAPLRLTVRGKRVLAALLIVGAAALGSVGGAVLGSAEQLPAAVTTVTVSSGDTLWSIAADAASPGADVRDVVAQIADLNGLQGSQLAAGQQLEVPAGD